jgi:methylenetetrahydrofolate dehydrogenase (NADP+)/methenyltetrahydrofolate cyclohydrolase
MILNGKELSKKIRREVREKVASIKDDITLLVILVGDDPASQIYVHGKEKACLDVGIKPITWYLDKNITEDELISKIHEANLNPNIHAILVQLPLPKHLDEKKIINEISPNKDVDGLTNINQGKLFNQLPTIVPATPLGVMHFFSEYNISLSGKKALVIGRSNLVGKSLAMLLLNENATVTIAHSKTKDLEALCCDYDIIISCVGKPNLIRGTMVKDGAIVVDVGISRIDGKVVGDVCFEEVEPKASYITPVPGGVGPMTIATLLENVIECYRSK